jgi:predicted nucleic acid-binding protein
LNVLLDTSVVIDLLRGRHEAIRYARTLDAPPTCSEITRVEVLRGVRSAERGRTERVFGSVRWVPVDEAISRRAGQMGRELRRRFPGLATADLIIAATCLESGLELATCNVRHFPAFEGLRPPYVLP